jgi:enhancer of polycomb-like protein
MRILQFYSGVRHGHRGVLRVDRRTTHWSPPCDESLSYPRHLTRPTTADSEMVEEESTAKKEVSWRICDHWLFDADDEPSVGPNGPDEKDRVLVDEFHPKYAHLGGEDFSLLTALLRYLLKGMSLYQEDDHQWLTTDPTIYTPSSDGHLFGFLPYRMGIAPVFRHNAIIVGPCPHGTQTPQATAAQQHQQQLSEQ